MHVCDGPAALILAQVDQAANLSWTVWLTRFGIVALLVPLLGFANLAGACVVVAMNRRPAVIAAYLLFVPLPLILAVFDVMRGMAASFIVITMADATLKSSEYAAGNAEALLEIMSGLLATIPPFLVIAAGLFVRTLQAGKKTTAPESSAATRTI